MLWFVITMGIILSVVVVAPVSSSANELNFSVLPNLPDNQIDRNQGYYNLKLAPGQAETTSVTLSNNTDKDIVVGITLGRATTGLSGTVQYLSTNDKDLKTLMDKSFKHDIVKLVDVPKQQTIPAHSSVEVPINIQMPTKAFKGVTAMLVQFRLILFVERVVKFYT